MQISVKPGKTSSAATTERLKKGPKKVANSMQPKNRVKALFPATSLNTKPLPIRE
jgi:hypothetical protein